MEETAQLDPVPSEQTTPETSSSGSTPEPATQTVADVPLVLNSPKASAGEIVQDGLVYTINPDGVSVTLAGWHKTPPTGEVAVPAEVSTGTDSYVVSGISTRAFEDSQVVSLCLPETITTIADDALAGCSSLTRVSVSSANETYASFDGMLFSKDLSHLLTVPEGKEGSSTLPDQTASVPAGVLSRVPSLCAVVVGEGSSTLTTQNGLLYSKDLTTLIACPVGAGEAVVIPEEVTTIDTQAFAGCTLSSIAVRGVVDKIAFDAFDDAAVSATVALLTEKDYEARKAVWEAAGFTHFIEVAAPGEVVEPERESSGFTFTLLDDYTLSVSWTGEDDPEGNLTIPATAEVGGVSYRVSTIAERAFENRTSIQSVTLPTSVTTLEEAAFAGCVNLTSVKLSDNLYTIGDRAFEATALQDIWLSAHITSIGERAFADTSLVRLVALSEPWVADSALAGCTNTTLFCPNTASIPWNVGLPASGNHLAPYGIELAEEPLSLKEGSTANLFDNGTLNAPEPVELSFSYAAKPLSVDQAGIVSAKAQGTSEVAVTLSLDGVELARASRTVEVVGASTVPLETVPFARPLAALDATPIAAASITGIDGSITWEIDSAGKLSIYPSDGKSGTLSSFAASSQVPWYAYRASITAAHIAPGVKCGAMAIGLFAGCSNMIEVVGLENLNTNDTEFMGIMFLNCSKLESLDLSSWTTPKARALGGLFNGCSALKSVDVSRFDTSKVTAMDHVFYNCSSLETIDLTSWDTSQATTMVNMFSGCSNLTELDVSGFKTGNVGPIGCMFEKCSKLEVIDVADFDLSRATSMNSMFAGCLGLRTLDLSTWSIPKVENTDNMFRGCSNLSALYFPSFATSSVHTMVNMFYGCTSLTALPSTFAVPDAADMENAFTVSIEPGQPRIPMYYSGRDARILNYDWERSNRTLVTDSADMEGFGMQQATFKVQSADADAGFPWEVRSTAWSNKQGILADPGTLQLAGYTFSGWHTDEECLKPFDFSKPLTEATTLYGKWVIAGGRDSAEGALPTKTSDGTDGFDAWWCLTADGVLTVGMHDPDSVIQGDFGWTWSDDYSPRVGYWGPYVRSITDVCFDPSLRTNSMRCWFLATRIKDLTDNFFIPAECDNLCWTFGWSTVERLPEGMLTRDSQVYDMRGMLQECYNLVELPKDFVIPDSCKQVSTLFHMTPIRALPDGFTIPTDSVYAHQMFYGCRSLEYLPDSFRLPSNPECTLLGMFANCPSLRTLPANLLTDVDPTRKDELNKSDGLFGLTVREWWPSEMPLKTYFPATQEELNLIDWSAQNRVVVTNPASEGRLVANLMLPDETGAYGNPAVSQVMTNASGLFDTKLDAPLRPGYTFAGWYMGPDADAVAYDFTKTPVENGVTVTDGLFSLYAKYAATSGPLPTTDGASNATWNLSADGTLTISCKDGATIAAIPWDPNNQSNDYEGTWSDIHWGPLRDQVRRIVMDPGVKAENMACWFAEMHNLVDISEAFVPAGVYDIRRIFYRCTALPAIPDGFVLPEGITHMSDAFGSCEKLESIASGFTLPSTVQNVGYLFNGCLALRSLPAGFLLPDSLSVVVGMLSGCRSLESLPMGFNLPNNGKITDVSRLFNRCYALKSLPEDFAIPDSVTDTSFMLFNARSLKTLPKGFTLGRGVVLATCMFEDAQSLEALPEGFSFPASLKNMDKMFKNCVELRSLPSTMDFSALTQNAKNSMAESFKCTDSAYESAPLITYHAATDAAKTQPKDGYWATQNRTLYSAAAGSSPLPGEIAKVEFKVQGPGEVVASSWTTVLATAEGGVGLRVSDPLVPSSFGYVFDGWYTDASFASDSKLVFNADGTAVVTGDTVLYGRYVLVLDVDVPVMVKVTIDASGAVDAASFDVASRTPSPLSFSRVESQTASGAARLIPREGDRGNVKLGIKLGEQAVSLPLVNGVSEQVATLPAAAPSAPSLLEGSIGFDLGGAQINYQPGDDITSLAKVVWTVEAG